MLWVSRRASLYIDNRNLIRDVAVMLRVRSIVLCLLALVLLAGQIATGAQALEMLPDAHAGMTSGEMSTDCDTCADPDSERALCPANCCTSCGTTAALVPAQWSERLQASAPQGDDMARDWSGLNISPHPTPPKASF